MKDEEMAEEYANGYATPDLECSFRAHMFEASKDGFLAGLKAGRPQWHDLRKDPNDLPEKYVEVLNEDGDKVRYEATGYSGWIAYSDYEERDVDVDAPIAWCEIPTFDKE